MGHLDINIYVELWNDAFELLPVDMEHEQRCLLADTIVTFARDKAEMITRAMEGHDRAVTLIQGAIDQLPADTWPPRGQQS